MIQRILILLEAMFVTVVSCTHQTKQAAVVIKYKAKVFQSGPNQFGYDIYQDNARMIHQPIIPGTPGSKAFVSENDAQRVADLMVRKLEQGISPPSITTYELDSLRIQK